VHVLLMMMKLASQNFESQNDHPLLSSGVRNKIRLLEAHKHNIYQAIMYHSMVSLITVVLSGWGRVVV
jgi:hypothetical protein